MHAGKTCLLQRRGKLTSHKRVIQRVEGMKIRNTVRNMTSVIETRVTELDYRTTLPPSVKVASTVSLIIDPKTVTTIERGLSVLGKMKVIPAETFAPLKEVIYLFV